MRRSPPLRATWRRYIIALCRSELARIRAHCGGELPWGAIDVVIKHWASRLAEDGELNNLQINWDRIKEALRHPSRARTR